MTRRPPKSTRTAPLFPSTTLFRSEPRVRTDLAAVLTQVCEGVREAGREVSLDVPDRLDTDGRAVALRRAFANLIGNAVKYGGTAAVRGCVEEGRLDRKSTRLNSSH